MNDIFAYATRIRETARRYLEKSTNTTVVDNNGRDSATPKLVGGGA